VVVGDLHINSTVGLLPYSTNLDDGGTYRSSKGQRWLWRNWLSFWEDVKHVKASEKAKVWTVFNGDVIDKNGKHPQTQNISQNEADILRMANDTVEPAHDVSDIEFVVRGTAAHSGSSGYLEEMFAADIGAEKCGDNYSWWELLLESDGVLFDIRHHGPLGRLPHTRGNALNRRAVELMLKYANQRCPDVAVQNHNHAFATSSDGYPVKVFSNLPWQLPTEFAARIGVINAEVGGMYFICDKGEYVPVVKRYQPERTRPWKAK
jgi:hypothetical protein